MNSETSSKDRDAIFKKEFLEHVAYQNELKIIQETIVGLQEHFISTPQCLCTQHVKDFANAFDKIINILTDDQNKFMNKEESKKKINEIKTSYRSIFVFCAN